MNALAVFEVDDLIKLVVFAVFFLLPVVKSIFDAKKRQREARERLDRPPSADAGPADEPTPADDGRAAWEALLRGESAEPSLPRGAPPAAAPPEPRPRRIFEEVAPERPYQPSLAGEITEIPRDALTSRGASPGERPVLTDSEPLTAAQALTDAEPLTNAPALTEAEALTNARALTDTPATEGTALSRLVATGEFQTLGGDAAPGSRRAARAAGGGPIGPLRGGSREWRRAIVLAEVLAPPVSLRRAHPGAPFASES
jgi:hypothetical protein